MGTRTVFADVERGFGGWLKPVGKNNTVNHAVYSGFLDRVRGLGYIPGVYSSIGEWEAIMGTMPAAPAKVEWAANYPCDPSKNRPGCPLCPTTFESFGCLKATIWQYTGQPPYSVGDLNVAISLPG